MTIVESLFGLLTETEDLGWVIRKRPASYRFDRISGRKAGMKIPGESRGIGASFMPILERLPVLSWYAKTRGWHYVISWLHRFTGIGLIVILIVHMYILSSWQTPDVVPADMK